MTIAQQLRQQGFEKGVQQGILEGEAKGIEKGLFEGMEQVAMRMLRRNRPLEDIIEDTGLSLEKIVSLKKKVH